MKDYCGVVGVYGSKHASQLAYLALYALQHRGEESTGIVSFDRKKIYQHKGQGLVADIFKEDSLKKLKGPLAIGHVRYSTTGSSTPKNVQPLLINHKKGFIAVAHNGNLTNSVQLRNELEDAGSILQTTMDSELILHLLVKDHQNNYSGKLLPIMNRLEGAFSFIIMINDAIYAMRDPHGFRPLCIGKAGDAYIVASETCALDMVQAAYVRDVEPGEIVIIDKNGLRSLKQPEKKKHAFCIFEYIYFSRPDSNIFGQSVYLTRKNLGRTLAKEHPIPADMVMPIPDSGTCAALGYAEESKLPLEMAFVRNHYIGRTFIQPSQLIRDFKVKVKLNPVRDALKDKRIIIVEDSIVRGTTSKGRVRALREAGAREIHMMVSCPPIISPCFYGIDFPTKKELIASSHTIEKMREFIGVDSLKFISLDGMLNSMLLPREEFCTACFTGNYPTTICKPPSKKALEKARRPGVKKD
ncbi:MAG: amidophosphoribosyltransferase [Candidatus Omnitrophica bacterium]|nr:amidophosphoribosyltransferase [Candidatus Omnitrophota bacterium]